MQSLKKTSLVASVIWLTIASQSAVAKPVDYNKLKQDVDAALAPFRQSGPTTAQEVRAQKAQVNASLARAYALHRNKDYKGAYAVLQPLAVAGNDRAVVTLASMFIKGEGVNKDPKMALKLLYGAAAQNSALAKGALGAVFFSGIGVPKDNNAAYRWVTADNTSANGLYLRGLMLERGLGIAKDPSEAFRCYSRSSYAGSVDGKVKLGECYYLGKGTAENHKLAAKLFKEGAEAKSAVAQLYLAEMMAKGDGIEPNPIRSREVFSEAEKSISSKVKDGNPFRIEDPNQAAEITALVERVRAVTAASATASNEDEKKANEDQGQKVESEK